MDWSIAADDGALYKLLHEDRLHDLTQTTAPAANSTGASCPSQNVAPVALGVVPLPRRRKGPGRPTLRYLAQKHAHDAGVVVTPAKNEPLYGYPHQVVARGDSADQVALLLVALDTQMLPPKSLCVLPAPSEIPQMMLSRC